MTQKPKNKFFSIGMATILSTAAAFAVTKACTHQQAQDKHDHSFAHLRLRDPQAVRPETTVGGGASNWHQECARWRKGFVKKA